MSSAIRSRTSSIVEQLLLGGGADGAEAGRDEVGEPARLGDVRRQRVQVLGQDRRQLHDLLEVLAHVALKRVDLERVHVSQLLGGLGDFGPQVRLRRRDTPQLDPREALDDQAEAAVGQLEHLVDVRQRADRMQIVLAGFLAGRIVLREDADDFAAGDRIVDELDGAFARHRERHERVGKQHRVAQRQRRHIAGTVYDRSWLGLAD